MFSRKISDGKTCSETLLILLKHRFLTIRCQKLYLSILLFYVLGVFTLCVSSPLVSPILFFIHSFHLLSPPPTLYMYFLSQVSNFCAHILFRSLYPLISTVVYSICILITCFLLVYSLDCFIAQMFPIVSGFCVSVPCCKFILPDYVSTHPIPIPSSGLLCLLPKWHSVYSVSLFFLLPVVSDLTFAWLLDCSFLIFFCTYTLFFRGFVYLFYGGSGFVQFVLWRTGQSRQFLVCLTQIGGSYSVCMARVPGPASRPTPGPTGHSTPDPALRATPYMGPFPCPGLVSCTRPGPISCTCPVPSPLTCLAPSPLTCSAQNLPTCSVPLQFSCCPVPLQASFSLLSPCPFTGQPVA